MAELPNFITIKDDTKLDIKKPLAPNVGSYHVRLTAEDVATYNGAEHTLGGVATIDIYLEIYQNQKLDDQVVYLAQDFLKVIPFRLQKTSPFFS